MTLFRPHWHFERVADIPLERLAARGIRGVLLDIDNTLAHHGKYDIEPEEADWLRAVLESGIKIALYSNAQSWRIKEMARRHDLLPGMRAYKPINVGLSSTLQVLGLPKNQVALIGDQLFTDVLAGKWGGVMTILIEPRSRKEWVHTRGFRHLERMLGRRAVGEMLVLEPPDLDTNS